MIDILQMILSVLTLLVAIYIPEKIKWEQIYSGLLSDYRGYDVGAAIQGVIDFFVDRCNKNVEEIPYRYKDIIKSQKIKNPSNEKNLHFQRRLLAQFYWQLYECVKSPFIGKRRVKKDFFSKKEANLMRILYYMDKAIDEDESGILYKDISSFEHVPKSKKKNMNSAIAKMYYILGK